MDLDDRLKRRVYEILAKSSFGSNLHANAPNGSLLKSQNTGCGGHGAWTIPG